MSYALKALAIFVAVGLLSCSKKGTEPQGGLESNVPMAFAPSVEWAQFANTRSKSSPSTPNSLINSPTDLQGYSISILANATRANSSGEGTPTYTTYPVFKNHRLDWDGSAWTYSPTKYWIPGAEYSFVAFAPFAPTENSNSVVEGKKTLSNGTFTMGDSNATDDIDDSDANPVLTISNYCTGRVTTGDNQFDARSEDLLKAVVYRVKDDYSPVELKFQHLLACVNFNIRNATSRNIIKIDNIALCGIDYRSNIKISPVYDVPIEVLRDTTSTNYFISNERTGSPFLPKGMAIDNFVALYDCTNLTVLPQTLYGKNAAIKFTVHYELANGQTETDDDMANYKLPLGNIEAIRSWDPGKKYNYNMTITSQDIIFQVVEVPWIEHEVEL